MAKEKLILATVMNGIGVILIILSFIIHSLPIGVGIGFLILFYGGLVLPFIESVGQDTLGYETFLGREIAQHPAGSGGIWMPTWFLGYFKLEKLPSYATQFQLPADEDYIFKGTNKKEGDIDKAADKEPLPPGMVRPIRITTAGDINSKEPLEVPMSLEVNGTMRFVIFSPRHFKRNFGGKFIIYRRPSLLFPGQFEDIMRCPDAERQLTDVCKEVLAEDFSKKNPKQIQETYADINKLLLDRAEKLIGGNSEEFEDAFDIQTKKNISIRIDSWGLRIESFNLLPLDFGHKISASFQDVADANIQAKKTVIDAKAKKEASLLVNDASADKIKKEGMAEAEIKEAFLKAEAMGYKEIAEKTGIKEADVILKMKAFEAAITKAGQNGHILLNMPEFAAMSEIFRVVNNANTVK